MIEYDSHIHSIEINNTDIHPTMVSVLLDKFHTTVSMGNYSYYYYYSKSHTTVSITKMMLQVHLPKCFMLSILLTLFLRG